jgi:hypothetical protein
MPKDYIARLVLDRRHRSVALVAQGGTLLGGITYRVFKDQVSGITDGTGHGVLLACTCSLCLSWSSVALEQICRWQQLALFTMESFPRLTRAFKRLVWHGSCLSTDC